MRLLMPLLSFLNCLWVYQRNYFLDHLRIIMIVSRYTQARKISMATPDWSEWVPTSFFDNSIWSSPKEIAPDLSFLIDICDVIIALELSAHIVFTGDSSGVSGYDCSHMMISAHIWTRQRCFSVCHWVNVEFLAPFCFAHNVVGALSGKWVRSLLWACYASCKTWYPPSARYVCAFSPLWGLWITRRTSYRRKRIPRSVVLSLCLGGNSFSYRCGTIVFPEETFGDWWEVPPYYNPLVSSEVLGMSGPMCLGPGCAKETSWSTQIHTI